VGLHELETDILNRTRRFFHGRATVEYPSSDAHHSEGSRVSTKTRLLFSILDDGRVMCADGKGSWIG
jgi:hypothetical protein